MDRALEDFRAAEYLLRGGYYDLAAFHAQQAAEKALKALWLERFNKLPPRTHVLQNLARELGLDDIIESARFVSSVYYISRYPDAGPRLELQDAVNVLTHAEKIINRVKEVLAWA